MSEVDDAGFQKQPQFSDDLTTLLDAIERHKSDGRVRPLFNDNDAQGLRGHMEAVR